MSTRVQTYNDELLYALRMRDVSGQQIAEALAEVHSHVAETGEDPRAAFGPPQAYALEVAAALDEHEESPPSRRGLPSWGIATYWLGGAAGAWLLLDGVLAFASGGQGTLGLPPVAPLLLGLAVLIAMVVGLAHLARRKDVPVLNPLTGEDMTPPLPRWMLPAMIAPPAFIIGLVAVLGLAQR
ncbi:MAG: hypothetical protein ABI776_08420 [Nocardioidaceae bacterium]